MTPPAVKAETQSLFESFQKAILYKKGAYAAEMGRVDWRCQPVVMKAPIVRSLRLSTGKGGRWLILPWDGDSSAELADGIRTALCKISRPPEGVVVVTSSEGLSKIEGQPAEIPLAVVQAGSGTAWGDKTICRDLKQFLQEETLRNSMSVDLDRRFREEHQIKTEHGSFQENLLKSTRRVFITPLLLAVCVVVFIVMVLNGVSWISPEGRQLIDWGADFRPSVLQGEWWRLLTSAFVHIGIVHLLLNLYCLFLFGPLIERIFGNAMFLVLYVYTAVGGSIASFWWSSVNVVSAGASGAIFGILGGLLGFMAVRRKTIPPTVFKRISRTAVGFVIYNGIFGLLVPNIDHAAHVGGFVTGILAGGFFNRPFPAVTGHPVIVRVVGVFIFPLIFVGSVLAARERVADTVVGWRGYESAVTAWKAYEKGEYQQAVALYDKAEKSGYRGIDVYQNRSWALAELGQLDRAIQDVKRAIALQPRDANLYWQAGGFYQKKGEAKSAREQYDKALKLNPKLHAVYILRARLRLEQGDADGAIEDCNKAIELNKENTDGYWARGWAKDCSGDWEGALEDYERALKIKPDLTQVRINHAGILLLKREFRGAIKDLEQAEKEDPDNPYIFSNRALALAQLAQYEQAIEQANRAITLCPEIPYWAYAARGLSYLRTGDRGKALSDFERYAARASEDDPLRSEVEGWRKEASEPDQ